ncbi:MAG TPA: hypothetical protein VF884_07785 [Nitrososphaeraceae archaeon]
MSSDTVAAVPFYLQLVGLSAVIGGGVSGYEIYIISSFQTYS